MHQGPGRPVIMTKPHGAAESRRELLARLGRNTRTAASRAHTRSRIASWAGSGTHTDDSSPARCNLARLIASRRSVLTRSPKACRGINDRGDYDAPRSCPASLSWRSECRNRKGRPRSKIEGASHDSPASPPGSPQRRRCVRDLAILPAKLPRLPASASATAIVVFVHIQADVDDTLLHDPSPYA